MEQWIQTYDPLGTVLAGLPGYLLSALAAAIPLIILFYMLAVKRTAGHKAALVGTLSAVLLAILVWGMPVGQAVSATVMGACFGIFPIVWIVITAVWVYNMTVESGEFEIIKNSLASHDITDSAAAGTALATGQKTRNGVVGLTSAKWGRLPTLAEQAKKNGRRVGIVSSAPINHATPATFYAHISSRFKMYDIGRQLIESDFDYFGGGGFQKHDAKGRQSLYDLAEESGLVVLRERQDIQAARYEHGKTILAVNPVLNGREAMPDGLDLFRNGDENGLGLNEFVQKGIELLENENGFFMMVEGGKIDWAGHDNEAERLIFEILEFNLAVESALEFAAKHPEETLIVVTADHETGDLRKEDKGGKGGRAFDPGDWPGAADPVFKQAVADLAWHDREHSDVRVPVYALGRGSELFSGHYDNTDVAWKLFGSMQATPGQIVY